MQEIQFTALRLLRDWATNAENYWADLPDGTGYYGTGYDNWGVQTNQKYVTALAALATCSHAEAQSLNINRDWAVGRAVAALRFSLASHKSGAGRCTNGTQWGRTWISALGIERMMTAVNALDEHLTDADRAALRAMLESEADYLLREYGAGDDKRICANVWNHSGQNHPESNGWNGALLWRTAENSPDHPDVAAWRERAHQFLINAVSLATDANDETLIAGKTVRERHIGANFFPNFALDHHGYFNVGYMAICVSGAAMSWFDLKAANQEIPDSLLWHVEDLWRVLRRMVFSDGRLARIGGDTRVRYAYCQEYLLPAILLATQLFGEQHGEQLIGNFMKTVEREVAFNGDGSFYGKRLDSIAQTSPYYYTRLESDRACVLGLLRLIGAHVDWPQPTDDYEKLVAGLWLEPEYGAALHRSPRRLASFAWRAFGMAQGLCLPPDDGNFAEWEGNLCPLVRFMGDDGIISGGPNARRRLIRQNTQAIDGGFLTWGAIEEGVDLTIPEGCVISDMARTQIVFCALPDDQTVVGLQFSRALDKRAFPLEIKGLHWCLPNDLFNDFKRTLHTAQGTQQLSSPPDRDGVAALGSLWANVDDVIGVVGLYGAPELSVCRTARRRAGKFRTLFVEEICLGCELGARPIEPDTVILDCGWAMLSSADAAQTADFAARNINAVLDLPADCRGLKVSALNGKTYVVAANFGDSARFIGVLGRSLEAGEAGFAECS